MADKLTDYYCAKKAEMSKMDYDDTPVICERRAEQLSPTVFDNSTVLGVITCTNIDKSTKCCMLMSS